MKLSFVLLALPLAQSNRYLINLRLLQRHCWDGGETIMVKRGDWFLIIYNSKPDSSHEKLLSKLEAL
uniref:Putative secreted protein n=1 Tax=Anopheles triannulatus TaxID=58253 RepID=A0A2M4B7V0_9DIPT